MHHVQVTTSTIYVYTTLDVQTLLYLIRYTRTTPFYLVILCAPIFLLYLNYKTPKNFLVVFGFGYDLPFLCAPVLILIFPGSNRSMS